MNVGKVIFSALCLVFGLVHGGFGQDLTITGSLRDELSQESLIGGIVFDSLTRKGTVTNEYGYYTIKVAPNTPCYLVYSYVGYDPLIVSVRVTQDTTITVGLKQSIMNEVTIVGKTQAPTKSLGTLTIYPAVLSEYPKLNAEVDVIKIIQKEVGVQPGLEGSSGFSVRGGDNNQNLILVDNVPLYSSAHLAGFVSIFDPFAINSLTLHKSGIPAQHGGRASSVLDVYLKEGNMSEHHGEFTIGLLSSKAAIEGPLKKDKSSFMVAYRRSILDLLLNGFYAITDENSRFNYVFDDLTAKTNFKIGTADRLYVSLYRGSDRLESEGRNRFQASDTLIKTHYGLYDNKWGNKSASVRWNHVFRGSTFYNATVAYSNFNYGTDSYNEVKENASLAAMNDNSFSTSVNDLIVKNDFDFFINNNSQVKAGIHFTNHAFTPLEYSESELSGRGGTITETENLVTYSAGELFGYVQGEFISQGDKLRLSPGIRIGQYFLKDEKGFFLAEPRIAFEFRPSSQYQWEIDYSLMNQTVHSLNPSGISLTPDIWVPVTSRLKPSQSHHISLSNNAVIEKYDVNIQTAVYYKRMVDLIDVRGNSGYITSTGNWDEKIVTDGQGTSYGFELMTAREFNNFFIRGNYSYSRSWRKFEEINDGMQYRQTFDRPHNVSLHSVVKLSERINISGLWTYMSGQPITLGNRFYAAINNHEYVADGVIQRGNPNSYLADPNYLYFEEVVAVDEKHNFRMPQYHRMDISVNFKKQWKNNWNRVFSISVYNAYNRKNAYFIYSRKEDEKLTFYKFTLFPILPTLSYSLKF